MEPAGMILPLIRNIAFLNELKSWLPFPRGVEPDPDPDAAPSGDRSSPRRNARTTSPEIKIRFYYNVITNLFSLSSCCLKFYIMILQTTTPAEIL